MKRLIRCMAGVWFLMGFAAFAQYQPVTPVYEHIVIDDLERVLGDARMNAFKGKDPEIEFVQVKLYLKDYVAQRRLSDTQEIRFCSPGRFKSWLKDIAGRTGRQEPVLLREIVESFAPNACPELTGAEKRNSDYYRDRALEELAQKRLENESSQPNNPPAAASAAQTMPEPARTTTDEAYRRDEDVPKTVYSISSTNTTASASQIEIEVLPPPHKGSPALKQSGSTKAHGRTGR